MPSQYMVFTPDDPSSGWLEGLVDGLNAITDWIEGGLNAVGIDVEFGRFFVKDGEGYLPLYTATVQLSKYERIGALLGSITSLLWTITKIGFGIKIVDVITNPQNNWGWYALIALGVGAFAFAKGR